MSSPARAATATLDRERPGLLTVAELRAQLERLERHGCGDWEIDIAPVNEIPTVRTGEPDLAFDVRSYGIASVDAVGDGSLQFVLLKFAPGA
jgi:hypothetical protein